MAHCTEDCSLVPARAAQVSIGCGSISLNADAVLTTLQHIVAAEKKHPPVQ